MESLLQRIAALDLEGLSQTGDELVGLLAELVETIRPHKHQKYDATLTHLRALSFLLTRNPEWRAGLQRALNALFRDRPAQALLTRAGILPSTGFFTEAAHRIGYSLLPEVVDTSHLRGVLRRLFPHKRDAIWVCEVPDEVWCEFLAMLFPPEDAPAAERVGNNDLFESMRTLSYWIAASGLEPEMMRLEPALSRYESPFVAQSVETQEIIATATSGHPVDGSHLLVLIDQCHDWIDRIRRQALRFGTSIALTFRVRRLRQLLKRLERLTRVLTTLQTPANAGRDWQPVVLLFKRLVKAECLRNDLGSYWRQHVSLLAVRITENAGKAGEHYITSDRGEYFALLRSALGAGIVIACMALIKTLITKLELAPLNESLAICLNYGLGFVLIHLLHGTVATKQPAMTANAIAASLGGGKGKINDPAELIDLIARTSRSQIAAILGNIGLAIPTAMLIGALLPTVFGAAPYDADKAAQLLAEVHPLHSLALFYAAVAGVCLFLAGLISGYFDNLAAYNDIPARIEQLPWARRFFGESRTRRAANYIGDNLGALSGNFFFGFLLGGAWTIGILFGLPLDIRHVAFSSANLGYALAGSGFAPDWVLFAWAAAGVLLIGAINLAVSFALALTIALRSRRLTIKDSPRLWLAVIRGFMNRPRDFLFPPSRLRESASEDGV